MNNLIRLTFGAVALSITVTDHAIGQAIGYRVETDVFVDGVKEPLQQSLTLFSDGVGYDISREEDGEFTMVDASRDRIILLNTELGIRTEVKISSFKKLIESAKASPDLADYVQSANKVQHLADRVRIGDELLLYEATLQEPSKPTEAEAICDSYRQFADALIMLNSTRPGSSPPFARLALNEAIQAKGCLPKEIQKSAKRGQSVVVHKVLLHATWLLSKSDQSRIADIGKKITSVSYEDVGYVDYQQRMAKLLAAR